MSLWLRRRVGVAVFLVGVLLSSMFVPMTICSGLGYKGTSGPRTRCDFQGYFFVIGKPDRPHTSSTRIRVDHFKLSMQILAFAVIGLVVGFDYTRLSRKNDN